MVTTAQPQVTVKQDQSPQQAACLDTPSSRSQLMASSLLKTPAPSALPTLKRQRSPDGRRWRRWPLLQLPLLVLCMRLRLPFKRHWCVLVVHVVHLARLHRVGLVRVLVGGCACTTQKATETFCGWHGVQTLCRVIVAAQEALCFCRWLPGYRLCEECHTATKALLPSGRFFVPAQTHKAQKTYCGWHSVQMPCRVTVAARACLCPGQGSNVLNGAGRQ